jgi:hypothetical protein
MVRILGIGVLVGLSLAQPVGAQGPSAGQAQLEHVRAALDKYNDPIMAVHDGYFSTLACVDFPEPSGGPGQMEFKAGGMGVHFLNPALIGQPIDSLRPQVLIYEPVGDSLKLVAAEWFVPTQVTKEQPKLFGRGFDGPMEGHHPIMPPSLHHWDLHVWLWKANTSGMFSPTNPGVKCPNRAYTFKEHAPTLVKP